MICWTILAFTLAYVLLSRERLDADPSYKFSPHQSFPSFENLMSRKKEVGYLFEKINRGNSVIRYQLFNIISLCSTRPFHDWGAYEFQILFVAGVLRQWHYQDFRQLPLLQPAWLPLLSLCWSTGELLRPKTPCLENQKINSPLLPSAIALALQGRRRKFGQRLSSDYAM